MASDEPRRRDDNDDKPKKWQCCVCRSTKEHRCYKCFCGKCPSYNKKITPRYGVNDRSYSRTSNSSSTLPRIEDTTVSESVPTDKTLKQSVEIKDLRTGDEHPPGFASKGDGDRYSETILPNSHPSIVEEQRGNDEVGKKSNEVDGGSSKSNAGSTSIWDILAAKELIASGKQEGWVNNVGPVSSLGLGSVNEQKGHSTGSASSWGDKRVEEQRGSRKQEEWVNRDGPGLSSGAKRVEEPRNQAGWGNIAGNTTNWGVPRGNKEVRDNRSEDKYSKSVSPVPHVESGSRWNSSEKRSTRESEELKKGNDELCNQKLPKTEVDGESSKTNTGSTSIWDNLAAKATIASGNQAVWAKVEAGSSWGTWHTNEPKGNATGYSSSRDPRRERDPRGNADRSVSSRDSRKEREPRNNAGRSFSSKNSQKEHEPRGNKEVRDNRSEDKYSKSVSPVPHVESGSRWNSSEKRSTRESEELKKGNDEPCNQKLPKIEVDGESSKTNTGSTSIWDNLAAKATIASGNQAVWAKIEAGSSWGTWHANEPKGNATRYSSSRDPRRERDPRGNADRSVSSRDSRKECEPRSTVGRSFSSRNSQKELEPRCYAGRYVSSRDSRKEPEPRRDVDRSDSSRGSRKELEPRRNEDRSDSSWNSRKERDSRGNADRSVSSRDPQKEREPRGNTEITSNQAQDKSSKPDSPIKRVISDSRWDSNTRKRSRGDQQRVTNTSEDASSSLVKKRRGFQEIVANSKPTRDGFSKPVFPIPEVESDPSRVACTVKQLRENPEVKTCRAGGGSAGPVLLNHHAEPSTNLVSLTVGNQEIIDVKIENEFPATVPSLAAKQSTDYPVSGEDTVEDGQYDAATKKIKGVIRANKKITDPANPSQRHAKPPPTVISGETCSSKQKLYDSENPAGVEGLSCSSSLDLVGPAKEIIWKGHFEFLKFTENKICEKYLAHSAAKVNVEAYKLASQMSGNLQFKMHPVGAFWPKVFKYDQPDARDIALYFYPQNYERSTKEYGHLLHLMSDQDLMLRSSMEGVDLLVFSSKLLCRHHQKFKGRTYYMWGVFRQLGIRKVPKVIPTASLGPTQANDNSK